MHRAKLSTMKPYLVREAGTADARAIAEVHIRSWRQGYEGIVDAAQLEALSVDERAERWRRILESEEPTSRTFVAEADESPVGFCSASIHNRDPDVGKGVGEIRALYVDPGRWRAGVGGVMLRTAFQWLREQGCDSVTVWVLEQNRRGQAFYDRFGFSANGVERENESTQRAEMRMRAPLGGKD
jgi:GNAT superfamily N-acetyltransferase